ncbi:hypothetical protein AC1031_011393 [Aphanomyces cochlioides]|nr:hypothetical protein AC1031_011393 [Aphanomyces cochlioides]
MDAEALGHLAGIIKHYSKVAVDASTDMDWHQVSGDGHAGDLIKWKSYRISRFIGKAFSTMQLIQAFPSFPFLEKLSLLLLNSCGAAEVFEFAASRPSLIHLDIEASNVRHYSWLVTTWMAQDLLQWSVSQPVRVFRMREITCVNASDPSAILTSILGKALLETFQFVENHNGSLFKFQTKHERSLGDMLLAFDVSREFPAGFNADHVIEYVYFFRDLVETKTTRLCLRSLHNVDFETAWAVLKPMIEKSKVEELCIEMSMLTTERMFQVVDTIRSISRLRLIAIGSCFDFNAVVELMAGAPVSSEDNRRRSSGQTNNRKPRWTVDSACLLCYLI